MQRELCKRCCVESDRAVVGEHAPRPQREDAASLVGLAGTPGEPVERSAAGGLLAAGEAVEILLDLAR
jgi:hypothetical protein